MSTEVYDGQRRLRERWDTTTTPRWYTRWDENGNQVDSRAFTPSENAEADIIVLLSNRETNRSILLDRAQTAIQVNLTALTTIIAIENQTSFNNALRDDALRKLAMQVGNLIKQNNALIRLMLASVRADALDATE